MLVPFLPFLVVASAMASHEHSGSMPQSARLKELLRRALASREPSEALAEAAKKGGVRVIAADFDLTMLTLHTGGSASDRPDNPIFKALSKDFDAFAAAANARGIQIAVVTFGDPKALAGRPGRIAGEPLVRRVLQTSGASFKVDGVFSFYPPLYSSPADYRALGLTCPMPHNKSYHIQKLRKQFGIRQQEVVLIDDDVNNCAAFAADGGVSLRVTGDRGFELTRLEVM